METLHDLVTFAASVVRASEKKERNDLGTFCDPGIPHFLELDPSFGASTWTQ